MYKTFKIVRRGVGVYNVEYVENLHLEIMAQKILFTTTLLFTYHLICELHKEL